jgi:hypothetical protein
MLVTPEAGLTTYSLSLSLSIIKYILVTPEAGLDHFAWRG